ncbi:hypothetical protein [Limnothrix sp. PR1529]|uniref:DUF6953 family protein n=1 Tax=Limnothrix sp. PR1529 TaxID=1704291 RepID=UPI0018FE9093|nr:hypothetical protein [Limnothrix sp. PR1529]
MSAKDVAEWMLKQIEGKGEIYQGDVVWEIQAEFGGEFVYENENFNLAISPAVLKEFRKITADTVVWSRGERMWRKRDTSDEPGRQQE